MTTKMIKNHGIDMAGDDMSAQFVAQSQGRFEVQGPALVPDLAGSHKGNVCTPTPICLVGYVCE